MKFKVGDRVRIINASGIERSELNEIGVIVASRSFGDEGNTYTVDMGKPRRKEEPAETCWFLEANKLELVCQLNKQLLFNFMYD